MVAFMGYSMIIVFMILIILRKITPFTGLVFLPVIWAILGQVFGIWDVDIGKIAFDGLMKTARTGIMLFFAIYMFSFMIDAGLFDPLSNTMIKFAKGDPLKVSLATVLLTILVSFQGDGTTTMIIVCTAMVPIYKKLNMSRLNLAVLTMCAHSIWNLLPWGGPTARALAVTNVGTNEIMKGLVPAMIVASIYMIVIGVLFGLQERKALGVVHLSDKEMEEMMIIDDPEVLALRRPKNNWINLIIVIITIVLLVLDKIPSAIIFMVGAVVTLMINYPKPKDQRARIDGNAKEANQVFMTVLAAGVFMGVLNGTKMSDAIAESLISIIPQSMGHYFGLIVAIISAFGTYFLHNDAFYYGMLPVLLTAGLSYGFTSADLAFASLWGQAFHLYSPLVPFSYVLLGMADVEWGEWQKKGLLVSFGIFVVYLVLGEILGFMPIYK